jgi:hypothetical protein
MLLKRGRVTPASINVTAAFIRRMIQMGWKRVKVALLATALAAGGAFFAAAVPASAATAPASATVNVASHTVPAMSRTVPAIPDASILYLTFVYSNETELTECFNGNSGSIAAPEYVSNGCKTIVWLYQNRSYTGYQLCLRPMSTTGELHRSYLSFRIGNQKSC